eukprot:TRINITY_DN1395_c0_g1_i2.p1 TRINITY_DN1395_c0_g1~~TRINITY_DN1395_c0_g1_i2.p1  ORF type:complete len:354 (-),score=87.51 TRINITY_DN1395_c0_g1_i2:19-1080(-)
MSQKEVVLVTGGAGYIGSHTVVELLEAGLDVVVIDVLSNASEKALDRVEKITKKKILSFIQMNLVDHQKLVQVFEDFKSKSWKVTCVVHFAGAKAVGESTQIPLHYYENNLCSTLNLLKVMKANGVRNLVFSSSATCYGDVPAEQFPKDGLTEDGIAAFPTNPYGRTKFFQEHILRDVWNSDKDYWNFEVLRYFNPVGAHSSGVIGEDPRGIPNNLMPYITQVAVGKRTELSVFGNDYQTRDGTGIRDYIHVVDLAKGHLAAVQHAKGNPGFVIFNLGCGRGYTVLEVVEAFSKACGKKIPYKICPRRPGDVTIYLANVDKANKELKWKAELGLQAMCDDSWRWQSQNPDGYN